MSSRELTEDELEAIEAFLQHAANIVGTTLKIPIRTSYSTGKLAMHFYIEEINGESV